MIFRTHLRTIWPGVRLWKHPTTARLLNVEMDVTNQCNLRCVMCYFADDTVHARKRADVTPAQFTRIAEQIFPLAHRVSLSVGTEPLLNPHFAEFVTIAQRFGVPRVYFNTNGMLLNPALIEHLVRSGIHAIGISIDGATRTTHERIRVGSQFEKVVSHIRAINAVKRRLSSATPDLTMTFVMMRRNIRELPAFVDLAHELEVPNVNAIHLVPYIGLDTARESLVHDQALCNDMLDEGRRRAARHQIAFRDPGNFGQGRASPAGKAVHSIARGHDLNVGRNDPACCPFPWHFIAIETNGDVSPCGWWHDEAPVGNIHRQTFDEIWNGEGYRRLRNEHVRNELRAVCRGCPAAGIGNVDDERAFASRHW